MTALALLGGLSGGGGGQTFGGAAGPSRSGEAKSGGVNQGLTFNPAAEKPNYTAPLLILGAVVLGVVLLKR